MIDGYPTGYRIVEKKKHRISSTSLVYISDTQSKASVLPLD